MDLLKKKKILLLSTGDINGAYEYIYRLGNLLIQEGHHVAMLVKYKTKPDSFIFSYEDEQLLKNKTIAQRVLLKIFNRFIKKSKPQPIFDSNYDFISVDETSVNVYAKQIVKLISFTPDYIFTGMTDRFMNSTDLLNLQQLTNAQVYNITVDMNHFTGGCHFAWDCKGYIEGCKQCPAIKSSHGSDIAKINFETKLANATKGKFQILTGSGWTLMQAKESKIYKNQLNFVNINSLIDTKVFNNKSRPFAKQIFNLKEENFYILMGCQNSNSKRKGFEYLLESLQILFEKLDDEQRQRIKVLIVSRNLTESFKDIPFEKQHIDYVNDYRLLSLLYQASDVFVNSSIEDSGPMMVSEALACGTPVVGFNMGVVSNLVINNFNGYKAELKNANDLAKGLSLITQLSCIAFEKMSGNAVNSIEELSSFDSAKKILTDLLK